MTRYARDTAVSVARSRAEIEALLIRYGAEEFASGWRAGAALVGFRVSGRAVQFVLPLPDRADEVFWRNARSTYLKVDEKTAAARWEQACRQRWRALALVIKAKLEAVESGITTFEQEFLAHLVVPGSGGRTVGQMVAPQLDDAYRTGRPVLLLAESSEASRD